MLNIQNPFQLKLRHRTLLFIGMVAFIAVILFPYGWLTTRSATFNFIISRVFGSQLSHVVGHFSVFAILGTAVFILIPRLLQYPPIYFAGMAVIGFLQEFFQLTTFKTRAAGTDDLFDFLVDMSAATAVYLLFWTIYKIKDVWYDKK